MKSMFLLPRVWKWRCSAALNQIPAFAASSHFNVSGKNRRGFLFLFLSLLEVPVWLHLAVFETNNTLFLIHTYNTLLFMAVLFFIFFYTVKYFLVKSDKVEGWRFSPHELALVKDTILRYSCSASCSELKENECYHLLTWKVYEHSKFFPDHTLVK